MVCSMGTRLACGLSCWLTLLQLERFASILKSIGACSIEFVGMGRTDAINSKPFRGAFLSMSLPGQQNRHGHMFAAVATLAAAKIDLGKIDLGRQGCQN